MKILTSLQDENILVQFTGHLRPFKLLRYYCKNLGCPCNDVTIELVEVDQKGRTVPKAICFRFKIDLKTWQKRNAATYGEPIPALMDEFMRDCPDELRATFSAELEHRRTLHRKLEDFAMPVEEIRSGILISFSEIMTDDPKYTGFPEYGWSFEWKGQTYYIDDRYCPNPKCECNTVHLVFLQSRQTGPTVNISEYFLAVLSLNGKKLEISDPLKCPVAEAETLVHQWLQAHPDIYKVFKWRYKQVRKAARRILKRSEKSSIVSNHSQKVFSYGPPPTAKTNDNRLPIGSIGRNDPCPCGSGKKYKKCCGRI